MDTPINIIEETMIVTIDDEITTVTIEDVTTVIEFTAEQGPSGPKGNPGDGISAEGETPTGVIDGINTNYVLVHTPSNGVRLYVNGMRQKEPGDYTLSSNIITFISPLIPGDLLLADYNY